MASIRRTLSPANHERHAQRSSSNLPSPFSLSISSSSSSPHLLQRILMGGILGPQSQRPLPRKWAQQQLAWKRSLLRLLLCFFIGFLLGFSPFYGLDDRGFSLRDFSFNDNHTRSPPSMTLTLAKSQSQLNPMPEVVKKLEMDASKGEISSDDEGANPLPPPGKLLIVVTPTYNRAFQAYYLSRLGQTLRLVPQPLLWIVVEMGSASLETAQLLRGAGIMYRHLVCERNSTSIKDRGVHQRNTALHHIEQHRMDGVVYFADDDNVYSLELFERLREIRRFGTWPVAMLAQSKNKATLEGPVCNGSEVIGWHTNEKSKRLRRFHVDMSGFGFNSTILWDPKRWRRPTVAPIRQLDAVKEGYQETTFIEQVVEDEYQMEGLPYDCTKIMNWHLHLETKDYLYPTGWRVSRNLDVVIPLK